jgi:ABC-type lipoprotein release transport system permease subunit
VAAVVLRDGLRLAVSGTVLGAAIAVAAARLLRTQLYNVSPGDPEAYLAGAGIVGLAAVLASVVPAYQAARTNPLESLRVE